MRAKEHKWAKESLREPNRDLISHCYAYHMCIAFTQTITLTLKASLLVFDSHVSVSAEHSSVQCFQCLLVLVRVLAISEADKAYLCQRWPQYLPHRQSMAYVKAFGWSERRRCSCQPFYVLSCDPIHWFRAHWRRFHSSMQTRVNSL